MDPSAAVALGAALAGVVEATLLNPLTLLRNRRQAGYRGRTQWAWAWRHAWGRGLPLQLTSLVLRRAFSFGVVSLLTRRGWPAVAAGLLVGASEGWLLAPTRRIYFLQQTSGEHPAGCGAWRLVRLIVGREGWRGLWRGGLVNGARAGLGGGVYFATLAVAWRACPTCWAVLPGAVATALCTAVMNPAEVWLARQYRVRSRHSQRPGGLPRRDCGCLWRGLQLALLRAVPGSALNYWFLHAVAGLLAQQGGG